MEMRAEPLTPAHGQPVFYFDLCSPYAYLAAERIHDLLPTPPIWQPILLGALIKRFSRESWAYTDRREQQMVEVERRARQREMLPILWPEGWPNDMLAAMRAATYAAHIGRAQAFALAAFRQAFAGGKDLSDTNNVLIAAAACEINPRAMLKAIETQSIKEALREATDEAAQAGVEGVPTVRIDNELFWGDDKLEQAAALLL